MSYDSAAWGALAFALSTMLGVVTFFRWRAKGLVAGLRGAGWTILPVAAWLTGVTIWEHLATTLIEAFLAFVIGTIFGVSPAFSAIHTATPSVGGVRASRTSTPRDAASSS